MTEKEIKITFPEAKLEALTFFLMEQNEKSVEELLKGSLDKLYEKNVPVAVRKFVERDEEVRRLRNLNLKFILMSSPIYQMLIALCEYNKLNPDGMKKITNDEWVILLHEIDMASLGFVERLSTEYEYLLEEDIRFCCLVRLDFKYADIAYLWGCTSAAVYKRSWSVLEKMGLNKDKKVKLVDILRKV